MKILGVIPARYASTRFPAKPLADIAGKTMIEWVYTQASKAKHLDRVVIATDNQKIFEHVKQLGAPAYMTSEEHVSGTDRCYEALTLTKQSYDYVINIQGDEPFIAPEQIDLLASLLNGSVELATLIKKIKDSEDLFNHNVVKVITNIYSEAIYFSRNPLPHIRNTPEINWLNQHSFYKHIGMYGYRTDVLRKITELPPSSLEKAESLEQLRWIENGFKIKVATTELETLGVDTPADLEKAITYAGSLNKAG